jgi:hypothetical protein
MADELKGKITKTKTPLKCQGEIQDFEKGTEPGDGYDTDFDKAVAKAEADAMGRIKAHFNAAFATIKCPGKCETWLRLRTKTHPGPYGKIRDPRTQVIEVIVPIEWHIDIKCELAAELF